MSHTHGEPFESALYPRLRAPVYFTRLASRLLRGKRKPLDEPGNGLRVYTDEAPKPGARLEIEIFLPDKTSVICRAEVAWVEKLPAGAPARCDVGLRITSIHPHDRQRLLAVLEG